MEIVEARGFTRLVHDYLNDDEYREFQTYLAENPRAGDIMPGCGGFRKVRWSDKRRGKGKRGGLRVIYYFFEEDLQIWFMLIYDKDEEVDLTTEQKRMLLRAIEDEKRARNRLKRRKH